MAARFLTRAQVAEELNISMAQCYALLRRGELRAAKIGGRGDYRIGRDDLEAYLERTYAATERWIESIRSPRARATVPTPEMRPVGWSGIWFCGPGVEIGVAVALLAGATQAGTKQALCWNGGSSA